MRGGLEAAFVRTVSFPLYEWLRGSDLLRRMREFDRSQWLAPDQLKALQWERLKPLLAHAYRNVPYYQDTFKRLGATPADFRSLDDFAAFPALTKTILQERLPELLARNVPQSDLVKGVTSGSSGQPTYYVQERSSNRIRTAAGKRLTRIAGYDFGLRLFYLWRDSPFVLEGDQVNVAPPPVRTSHPLLRLKRALHDRFGVANPTIRVDPTLLTEAEMAKMFERLKAFDPHVIISYVNTLHRFAQYLEAEGLTGIRPRSVIVSSETLYQHQRELMERVFGCRVYNRYGLSETGIVAIECPVREGLHLNQEILHLEYEPTVGGALELVVTDLINYGMPLLRYRTGDTGRPLDGVCGCGRGLARIGDLSGRIIDLLPTRLGGYVNGQLFATFHWIPGVKQYQVIQERLDAFRLKIVPTDGFHASNLDPMIQVIRERFGQDSAVAVECVPKIPFTSGGKYKLVVSEVKGR